LGQSFFAKPQINSSITNREYKVVFFHLAALSFAKIIINLFQFYRPANAVAGANGVSFAIEKPPIQGQYIGRSSSGHLPFLTYTAAYTSKISLLIDAKGIVLELGLRLEDKNGKPMPTDCQYVVVNLTTLL